MNKKNKKIFNILLYGCGNIGSRHLQGIVKSKYNINIYVYDINAQALKLAKKDLKKIKLSNSIKSIKFIKKLDIYEDFFLIIIATSAKNRMAQLKEICNRFVFKYLIIEKIAFQNVNEFDKSILLLKNKKIITWVNCPNRLYNSYIKLKKEIIKEKNISMEVTGGKWGLLSNYIHYLDLFDFLINKDLNFESIHTSLSKPFNSKRKGYKEMSGEISFYTKNNDFLLVKEDKDSFAPLSIIITTSKIKIIIFENFNKAIIFRQKDKTKFMVEDFEIEFQSNLTKKLVDNLIQKKQCNLTTLKLSYFMHKFIYKIIKKSFLFHGFKKYRKLPIT